MGLYVITGGYGFIGKAVSTRLRALGHVVVIASRFAHPSAGCEWIEYNLKDRSTVKNLINIKPDGLFHLAWSTTPAIAEADPSSDISTNLSGTVGMIEEFKRSSSTKILLVSSGGTVYGRSELERIPENHPLNPIGVYGTTKKALELYASQCKLFSDLDIRIVRISNPFGSDQASSKMQGAATIFARKILRGDVIDLWGSGDTIRDYIDVADAADGLIAVMMLDRSNGRDMTFNVGSGQGLSLIDLIKHLECASGKIAIINFLQHRDFDLARNVLSIEKIHRYTGWSPGDTKRNLANMVRKLM